MTPPGRAGDRALAGNAAEYGAYHCLQDEAILQARREEPPACSGAGIVIVAGGPRYFTCAWVLLTILRVELRCTLPIQLWYLGKGELSEEMIALLRPFDVQCVDALAVRQRLPARRLGGWECKPFAVAHCPFRDVIALDADNVPLVDPARLLDTPEYRKTGAIFWPDIRTLPSEHPIWAICRIPFRPEPEVESGQLVIDKVRCWAALSLTRHLNDHSEFYYLHIHGDKETFHMAWRMLEQPYSMPPKPRYVMGKIHQADTYYIGALFQRDFQGREIFHHRTTAKWHAWGYQLQVARFPYWEACLRALAKLRAGWTGYVAPPPAPAPGDHSTVEALLRTRWMLYCRIGDSQSLLEFLPGGAIGRGQDHAHRTWRMTRLGGMARLLLEGEERLTCALTYQSDGVWRGHWLIAEHMPAEVVPLDAATAVAWGAPPSPP